MATDFAFLFYVNDWAGGTQWMTRLQRGGYLDLLLYQVNKTSFTSVELKNVLGADYENIWPAISDKFIEENGNYYNEKMRKVLELRSKFTQSRRDNRLGKVKEQVKITRKSLVKQVGNEKGNDNKYSYILSTFKKSFDKWMQYKIDRKEKYKSAISEKTFYDKLFEFSNGNPVIAEKIIDQSIANNWAGIFELKDGQNKEVKKQSAGASDYSKLVNG